MFSEDFYVALGNMAYALAMADGVAEPEEKASLVNMLKNKLLPLEDNLDEFGVNVANYATFAFEVGQENAARRPILRSTVPAEAIDHFLKLVRDRQIPLSDVFKDLIMDILYRVANSSGGMRPEEQQVLDRLEVALAEL